MRTILLAGCLSYLLAGCSAIDYHRRDERALEKMAGYPVQGYSRWTPFGCDIYLLPVERYPSAVCYEAIIRHEERHCVDHDFHPATPEGSAIPECQ